MPKFTGAASVEPLEYDLTAFKPDPDAPGLDDTERDRRRTVAALPGWAGVIPEPSELELNTYLDNLTQINLAQAEKDEAVTRRHRDDQVLRWKAEHPGQEVPSDRELAMWDSMERIRAQTTELQAVRAESRAQVRGQLNAIVAAFCKDTPPAEVLAELPWRAIQRFTGWLSGQFSPEALAAAMNE